MQADTNPNREVSQGPARPRHPSFDCEVICDCSFSLLLCRDLPDSGSSFSLSSSPSFPFWLRILAYASSPLSTDCPASVCSFPSLSYTWPPDPLPQAERGVMRGRDHLISKFQKIQKIIKQKHWIRAFILLATPSSPRMNHCPEIGVNSAEDSVLLLYLDASINNIHSTS